MFIYEIAAKLAFPSPSAPADFKTKESDISAAISSFNQKYLGKKSLSIIELSSIIRLELKTKELVSNPTREFNIFSQELKNTYNWAKFSQKGSRMFDATLLEEPDVINKNDGKITLKKIFELETSSEVGLIKNELEMLLNACELKLKSFEK